MCNIFFSDKHSGHNDEKFWIWKNQEKWWIRIFRKRKGCTRFQWPRRSNWMCLRHSRMNIFGVTIFFDIFTGFCVRSRLAEMDRYFSLQTTIVLCRFEMLKSDLSIHLSNCSFHIWMVFFLTNRLAWNSSHCAQIQSLKDNQYRTMGDPNYSFSKMVGYGAAARCRRSIYAKFLKIKILI